MFLTFFQSKIKNPLPKTAEDKKFLWYHLNLPLAGPHGILTDPQAVSGPTRPALLAFQAGRSERNSASWLSLPFTCRQLSGKAVGRVLVFIIALRYVFSLVYHRCHHKSTKNRNFPGFFRMQCASVGYRRKSGGQTAAPTDLSYHSCSPVVNTYSSVAEFFCLLHDFRAGSLWNIPSCKCASPAL